MRKIQRDQSSTFRIADAGTARVFTREKSRRILLAFACPRPIAEVAAVVGEPIGKVFYHAQRFLREGLLRVVYEERRQGKPVKYYETVARTFFLPAELIEKPFTTGLADELRTSLEHNFYRADLEGVAVFTNPEGEVQIELQANAGANAKPSAMEFWQVLRLPDEIASELAADLRALLRKYEGLSGDGPEFLTHAAFAKRQR